jgi:hypothetical protein
MIHLVITSTAKGYHKDARWQIFGERTEYFTDKKEAMVWIRENYPNKTRRGMYRDTKEGAKRVGYVIGFRNSGWGSGSHDKWLQQDWIEFREVKTLSI